MKYNIEGGFDFYGELFSMLDKEDDENDICLITGTSLENEHITLECNHKFNYLPLIREISKQKYVYKTYDKIHLKDGMLDKFLKSGNDYFIRCPYCRNIQFEILPYRQDKERNKYYGINTLDKSFKKNGDYININNGYVGSSGGFYHKGVQYKYVNPGNCAIVGCKNYYCALNTEFNINYCYVHMGKEIRKKISDKKKLQKLVEKEKAKEEKIQAKEKAKQEKLEAKKAKVKPINSVISVTSAISEYTPQIDNSTCLCGSICNCVAVHRCGAILKTGLNKGKICGVKSANPSINNLCKRHSKKVDKNEENDVSKNVN